MHPTISYYLAHARIAGLRDQALRNARAREAGRARRASACSSSTSSTRPERPAARQPAMRSSGRRSASWPDPHTR
jgi:hypothetical protein